MVAMLAKIAVVNTKVLTFQEIKADFESNLKTLNCFGIQKAINTLREFGVGSLISDIKVTLL
jgi:hypothetical protein